MTVFFSLFKFCKTHLLFYFGGGGISKLETTFQKQENSQQLTSERIIKKLSGNMTI